MVHSRTGDSRHKCIADESTAIIQNTIMSTFIKCHGIHGMAFLTCKPIENPHKCTYNINCLSLLDVPLY